VFQNSGFVAVGSRDVVGGGHVGADQLARHQEGGADAVVQLLKFLQRELSSSARQQNRSFSSRQRRC
jgi:hypothetical protein